MAKDYNECGNLSKPDDVGVCILKKNQASFLYFIVSYKKYMKFYTNSYIVDFSLGFEPFRHSDFVRAIE